MQYVQSVLEDVRNNDIKTSSVRLVQLSRLSASVDISNLRYLYRKCTNI